MPLLNKCLGERVRESRGSVTSWGGGGDAHIETYTTTRKVDRQWEFAVCLGKLRQALCINLEGWGGEEDGREV